MLKLTKRRAIDLWILGFIQAGAILTIAPKRFARDTAWGYSPWQREIAIWNVGMVTAALSLRGRDAETDQALGRGFSVLSALFAANHLAELRRSPSKAGHWLAAIANLAGLGAWVIARRIDR